MYTITYKCDLCKKKILDGWEADEKNPSSLELTYNIGEDGFSSVMTIYHLCSECFGEIFDKLKQMEGIE